MGNPLPHPVREQEQMGRGEGKETGTGSDRGRSEKEAARANERLRAQYHRENLARKEDDQWFLILLYALRWRPLTNSILFVAFSLLLLWMRMGNPLPQHLRTISGPPNTHNHPILQNSQN